MIHSQPAVEPHPDNLQLVEAIVRLDLPPLIAPPRIARLLDIDRRRVYELIETGDLPAVRIGRRGLRVYRDGFLQWLRNGGSGPHSP